MYFHINTNIFRLFGSCLVSFKLSKEIQIKDWKSIRYGKFILIASVLNVLKLRIQQLNNRSTTGKD